MSVEIRVAWLPLATSTCEHSREIGYDLNFGIVLHLDDNSACRRSGLGSGVDEEMLGLDALAALLQRLLGDALGRIDTTLLARD